MSFKKKYENIFLEFFVIGDVLQRRIAIKEELLTSKNYLQHGRKHLRCTSEYQLSNRGDKPGFVVGNQKTTAHTRMRDA